jgi:hypothetical protein
MGKQKPEDTPSEKEPQRTTPTFVLELPVIVNERQAICLRGHREVGRYLSFVLLSEGQNRLRRIQADAACQAACAIPTTRNHEYGTRARVSWMADSLDAVLARGRDLGSIENTHTETGGRFVRHKPAQGHRGVLIWKQDQRRVSSERAAGADACGVRSVVHLALEGVAYRKNRHSMGYKSSGADLEPSTIALVLRTAEARVSVFCEEWTPDEQAIHRCQRPMDGTRREAGWMRGRTAQNPPSTERESLQFPSLTSRQTGICSVCHLFVKGAIQQG